MQSIGVPVGHLEAGFWMKFVTFFKSRNHLEGVSNIPLMSSVPFCYSPSHSQPLKCIGHLSNMSETRKKWTSS